MQIYRDDKGNPIERGSGEPPQNVHLHAVAAAKHAAELAEGFRDRAKVMHEDAVKVADYSRAAHKAIAESTAKNPDAIAEKEREAKRVEAENAKAAEEQARKEAAEKPDQAEVDRKEAVRKTAERTPADWQREASGHTD